MNENEKLEKIVRDANTAGLMAAMLSKGCELPSGKHEQITFMAMIDAIAKLMRAVCVLSGRPDPGEVPQSHVEESKPKVTFEDLMHGVEGEAQG